MNCRSSPGPKRASPRRIPRRAKIAAALVWLLVTWPGRPLQAGAPNEAPAGAAVRRVLLVVDRPEDPLLGRVRAEIAALGLTIVTTLVPRGRDAAMPLESVARRERAVAAIRVLPTRKGVEVWMADETSGRSLLRQVIVDESASGPDEGLIALQTAELLRTSLVVASARSPLPSKSPPAASSSQPASSSPASSSPASSSPASSSQPETASRAATPPGTTPARPLSPTATGGTAAQQEANAVVGVQVAAGALYSPGGTDTAIQLWLSPYYTLSERWKIALDLGLPVRPAHLSGPEGSAHLGMYSAGAALLLGLASSSSFSGSVGCAAALAILRARAETVAPLLSSAPTDDLVTGAIYLRAEGGTQLTRWLLVGVRAVLGGTLQRVDLRFAGNEAGTWGLPFAAGLLYADVHSR